MALRHRCRIEVQRFGVGRFGLWRAHAKTVGKWHVGGRGRCFWSRSHLTAEIKAQRWCVGLWSDAQPLLWVGPGIHIGTATHYVYYLDLTRLLMPDAEGEPIDGPDDGPRIRYEEEDGNRAREPQRSMG